MPCHNINMVVQHIISVDLQGLAEPFKRHCDAGQLTRRQKADFIRSALRVALNEPTPPTKTPKVYAPTGGAGNRKSLRTTVSPETYDRLLVAMKDSGARSMAEYLASVAEQSVTVNVERPKQQGRGLSPEAMQAITASNRELMALGKNVNQIARSLHQYPGKTTDRERVLLRALPELIQQHTETVAKWLLDHNPPRRRKEHKT